MRALRLRRLLAEPLRHAPLIVMTAGAGSLFLTNLLLAGILSGSVYGKFALTITIFSLAQLFGLLGAEQALVRVARAEDRTVTVPPVALSSILLGLGIFLTGLIIFLPGDYGGAEALLLPACAAIVALSMLVGNILRLQRRFVAAQATMSYWRFAVAAWCAWVMLIDASSSFSGLLVLTLVSGALVTVGGGHLVRRGGFTSTGSFEGYPQLLGSFVLTMGAVAVLSYGERFVILTNVDLEALGDYFLAVNLYVSPFILVGSYIGFIKLVDYKELTGSSFRSDVVRASMFGAVLIPAYVVALSVTLTLFPDYAPDISPGITALLVFLALLRLTYGPLSAGMGARGSARTIFSVNAATLLCCMLLVLLSQVYAASLHLIVAGIVAAWALRVFLFYRYSPMLAVS